MSFRMFSCFCQLKFGGKDGGNNFPANKFRYTLKNVDGEGWKLVDQVLLEQNK